MVHIFLCSHDISEKPDVLAQNMELKRSAKSIYCWIRWWNYFGTRCIKKKSSCRSILPLKLTNISRKTSIVGRWNFEKFSMLLGEKFVPFFAGSKSPFRQRFLFAASFSCSEFIPLPLRQLSKKCIIGQCCPLFGWAWLNVESMSKYRGVFHLEQGREPLSCKTWGKYWGVWWPDWVRLLT